MAKKKKARKGDLVDKKSVIKDLNQVLKAHGITAKIAEASFTSAAGAACTCPDGSLGVLRVVGGRVVCVCDG